MSFNFKGLTCKTLCLPKVLTIHVSSAKMRNSLHHSYFIRINYAVLTFGTM
jgi:hypothetical protein